MAPWNGLIKRLRPKAYGRRQPVVLINGLAEQPESWFRNRRYWGRYFEVHVPNILVYDGDAIHRRIEAKELIDVDWLVGQLHLYLDQFVQHPPYHLVASSLGGKVAVAFAVKYPQLVGRVVLLCPSGMGDEEKLPIMDGVRRNDMLSVVKSVFHRPRFIDRDIVDYYKKQHGSRRWKKGLLRAVRDTLAYTVRAQMRQMPCPTLLVSGEQDQICDPKTAKEAAAELPTGHFLAIPNCGHAPQIEKHRYINRLVVHFLTAKTPNVDLKWTQLLLAQPKRVPSK